jgi:formylmethanofuran dehydrogenase subunit C
MIRQTRSWTARKGRPTLHAMPLRLHYRGNTTIPVEVEGVTPDVVCDKSLADIQKLPIYEGNRSATLADFFDIQGDATDQVMVWEGDLRGVHWIGAKMRSGTIHIEGDAGRHVGSEMSGGEIHVRGNVGDWVGAEMHGGLIHVRGRAGHQVGAAYRGSARGMTRGIILICGDAGNEIGHTMRRGLIAIGGQAGDLAGFNMLAGTILLFSNCGIRHGAGMRRGTIGFLGAQRPTLLPSFRYACRYRPLTLDLLLHRLDRQNFALPDEVRRCDCDVYNGDMMEGGRGELILRANHSE